MKILRRCAYCNKIIWPWTDPETYRRNRFDHSIVTCSAGIWRNLFDYEEFEGTCSWKYIFGDRNKK